MLERRRGAGRVRVVLRREQEHRCFPKLGQHRFRADALVLQPRRHQHHRLHRTVVPRVQQREVGTQRLAHKREVARTRARIRHRVERHAQVGANLEPVVFAVFGVPRRTRRARAVSAQVKCQAQVTFPAGALREARPDRAVPAVTVHEHKTGRCHPGRNVQGAGQHRAVGRAQRHVANLKCGRTSAASRRQGGDAAAGKQEKNA